MVRLQLWLALRALASVAPAVKTSGPTTVGVPVIAPVEAFRVKPAGSVPLVIAKV